MNPKGITGEGGVPKGSGGENGGGGDRRKGGEKLEGSRGEGPGRVMGEGAVGSREEWGRGRGSGDHLPEHKDSKYQEAQRNCCFR